MFIDEWFARDYYQSLPLGFRSPANFHFGQVFWTHAYYPHENLQLWRPISEPGEPTKTVASRFQLVAAPKDAFNRGLPLHAPKLETNEEFVVIRAKRRPVILIQPEASAGFDNRGYRGIIDRHKCLVAQVFGLTDAKTGRVEFSPVFVERIRKMEYPQFFFLPKQVGIFQVDSFLRLDELQSVFTPHLDPCEFALGNESAEVLKNQFQYLWTGFGPSEYTELRELVLKS
jgi:hypothetical protein